MPALVEIELPSEKFVLGQVLNEIGDHRAELAQFVPLRNQFVPYFWIEHDDPSRVASTLREHPQVARVTRYDEHTGRTLYELEWAGALDDFLSVLLEQDILVTGARGTPDVWEFELLASDRDNIAAFQGACNEIGIPITIRSVTRATPDSNDRVGFTAKQRRVLELAYERGYFGVPRETTVAELAEELDISPQAASKRLRRGLEAMVDHVLADAS